MLRWPPWILFLSWHPLARGRANDEHTCIQISVRQAQEPPPNGSAPEPRSRWHGEKEWWLRRKARRAKENEEWRQKRLARLEKERHRYGPLLNLTVLGEQLSSASKPVAKEVSDRLLVFWPVGGKKAARDLVVENINHLQKFQGPGLPRPLHVDIFLAHYDGRRDAWREAAGASWYAAHVRYSLEYQGLKIWMARDILLSKLNGSSAELNSYGIDLSSYEYLWMVDEDADFNHVDVRMLIDLARESGSGIVTPAFTTVDRPRDMFAMRQSSETGGSVETGAVGEIGESGERNGGGESRSADGGLSRCQYNDTLCDFQAPKPQCRFRYVDFVEVSFPLVKPAVFRAVVEGCPGCMPERQSTWGVDHVWCSVAGWESGGPMRSCAVLDATPIVHQNQRTLPQYHDVAAHEKYRNFSYWVSGRVLSGLRRLWRNPPKELECIPAGSRRIQ